MGEVRGVAAADPVNLPMIRHWTDAMGDANPVYTDEALAAASVHGEIVAPPAMIQVWTMPGLRRGKGVARPVDDVLAVLDERRATPAWSPPTASRPTTATSGWASGSRPPPGWRSFAGPKTTALGEGYFVTWTVTWYPAGRSRWPEMMFRILNFVAHGKTTREEDRRERRRPQNRPPARRTRCGRRSTGTPVLLGGCAGG